MEALANVLHLPQRAGCAVLSLAGSLPFAATWSRMFSNGVALEHTEAGKSHKQCNLAWSLYA